VGSGAASLPDLTETDAILHVLQMVRLDPEAAQGVRNAMVPLAGHRNLLVTVWTFDAYCRTASGPGAAADREERIRQGLTNRSKAGMTAPRGDWRGKSVSMSDMSAAHAQGLGRRFGGSVPNVRRDHVIRWCAVGAGQRDGAGHSEEHARHDDRMPHGEFPPFYPTPRWMPWRKGRSGSGRRDVGKLAKMRQCP
jgi:hypothetical protein